MAAKGTATAIDTTGDFYVMFSGALVSVNAVPDITTGFVSAHFTADSHNYLGANYATYHRFTYEAAYT